MDMTLQLSRTVKGQEEIFNHGHSLRPRHRHILFSVGNGTTFGELRSKLPNCAELEAMVTDLLQNGFLQALRSFTPAPAAAQSTAGVAADFEPARAYVLDYMAALVGTQSPGYRKMREARDLGEFRAVLPMCHKIIAAVASPHQAAEMEAEVARLLRT
ncbi:MAG: hypothetical protein LDL19_05540 [Thiobacillus sp.]|nr:hypothetical protein [Thiobacillus sp.]